MFTNKAGETLIKQPGAVHGLDFVIEDLKDCVVYLLDRSAQITLDQCQDCRFYIGPVEGSIFFRDCSDCTVSVCCQQLRTKNCHRVVFNAMVASDPTIEYSDELQFGPYNFAYPKLDEHLSEAKLQIEDDHWSQVFDFNKEDGLQHWSLQNPANFKLEEYALEGFEAPVNPVPRHQKYGGRLTGPIPIGAQQQLDVEDPSGMFIGSLDTSTSAAQGVLIQDPGFYQPPPAAAVQPDLRYTDPFAQSHEESLSFSRPVAFQPEPFKSSSDPFAESGVEPGHYRPMEEEQLPEEDEVDEDVRQRLAARERSYQEQMRALYEKDEQEKSEKAERRRAAADELRRWRDERNKQTEQRKLYNRQQEESFLQARKGFKEGAQWKKVSSMIDFKESSDRADLSRMRQVLLAKKNEA